MNEKYQAKIQQAALKAARQEVEQAKQPLKQQTPGWARRRNIFIALIVLVCAATITIFATMDNYDIRVYVDGYGNASVYPADVYHHAVREEDGSIRMTISTGGALLM